MRYSGRTRLLGGKGAGAWDIHYQCEIRKKQGEDVLLLSIGDPDFDTPAPIVDSAIASIRAGQTHYSNAIGEPALRNAVAEHHSRNARQPVDADQVVIVAGAQCALFCAVQCILEAGDEVIIPEPMYVTYEAVMGSVGATIVGVRLLAENHFHVDPADIEAAVTEKTRAILLNTPHNPSGATLTREELEGVADTCIRHDLWLVCDEVYATQVFEGTHVSACSLPGMADRTITINSLSKSHAMTGWRLGWLVGPHELARHAGNVALCVLYGSPAFIQQAALVALLDDDSPREMNRVYRHRRDLVSELLADVDTLQCHVPEAGMFMMIDIRRTGLSSQEFAERLASDYGVSVLAADAFGPGGEGYVRLSFSVGEDDLRRASKRLAEFGRSFSV